uniref:C2H2-type domain-containing protein n=1 Tax=Eptatretus burgeri TaxID=7764 RepID=A0A8C4R232_EPTBU
MKQDLYSEDHRTNPLGSTSDSDGGSAIGPRVSSTDHGSSVGPPEEESGSDFIKVKVKSEFVDDSFPQDEGFIVKLKMKSEFIDESSVEEKGIDGKLLVDPELVHCPLRENQLEMVSYPKSSSQLLDTEVSFNQNMAQTYCWKVNKYTSVPTKNNNCITTFKEIERNKKLHKCSVCHKDFAYLSQLKMHERTHIRKTKFQTNRIRLNEQNWSSEGKESILYCQVYSVHEAWGTNSKGERFKKVWFMDNDPLPKKEVEILSSGRTSHHILKPAHGDNIQREKPFKCSQCGKAFSQPRTLRVHHRLHMEVKPFKCSQCGKVFPFLSRLKQHQRISTRESPYTCSECKKAFRSPSTLNQHQRIHTGEKPYTCSQCNKAFNCLSNLSRHQNIHARQMPFQCYERKKAFTLLSRSKQHQRVHTEKKSYTCSECNKAFTLLSRLKRHQSVHNKKKSYTCSECNKVFTLLSRFKQHQIIHTGEKPYTCSQCNKAFNCSSNLNRHQRSMHMGKQPH